MAMVTRTILQRRFTVNTSEASHGTWNSAVASGRADSGDSAVVHVLAPLAAPPPRCAASAGGSRCRAGVTARHRARARRQRIQAAPRPAGAARQVIRARRAQLEGGAAGRRRGDLKSSSPVVSLDL